MFDLVIRNIGQRKLRSSLTIFGIALGIFAVMVMGGMSENFNQTFDKSMKLTADKIRVTQEGGFFGGGLSDITVKRVRGVPGVKDAYGMVLSPLDPEDIGGFGENSVIGIPPEKQEEAMKGTKVTGRFLLPGETYRAVIGSSIARQYKIGVGDQIEIRTTKTTKKGEFAGRNFTVVGVLEYTGSFFDNSVQIPLKKAQEIYKLNRTVSIAFAIPKDESQADLLARRIELEVEGVKTFSPSDLRKQIEQQLILFTMVTISAAILAAIIGGLSVMNTMLMSVSERTREFGLLKAMGAETRDILFLTMTEAAVMGMLGGVIGIASGATAIHLLNQWLEARGTILFTITPRLVIAAIVFATALGIASGTYPAYRAARMSPMEALRYE